MKAKMVTTRHVIIRVFIEWTFTMEKKGDGLENVHQCQKLTTHEKTLLVQKTWRTPRKKLGKLRHLQKEDLEFT